MTTDAEMKIDDVWLHRKTWPEIETYLTEQDTVLIPIGATEQHGRHTPLLVDTAWACRVAEGVAESEGLVVAPPVHFGWSPHHMGYPGTITLRGDTLTQIAVDIGESLLCHGFKKLLFVNGNRVANLPPLQQAMARLRFSTDAYVAIIDTHLIARKEVCRLCGDAPNASHHAGDAETSFMMHAHPELVRAGDMGPDFSRAHGEFTNNIPMDPPLDANTAFHHPTADEFQRATAPYGHFSNPNAATAEKGKLILEATIQHAIAFVRTMKSENPQVKKPSIPV